MKEFIGMNSLLVTVEDNFPMTEEGRHILQNISEAYGCDIIMFGLFSMKKRNNLSLTEFVYGF